MPRKFGAIRYVPLLSSYICDHAALPRMSANADFSYHQIEVNRATAPQRTPANFSTGAVTSLLPPHTSCISLCTILWNVNFITCARSLSYPPWGGAIKNGNWMKCTFAHVQTMRGEWTWRKVWECCLFYVLCVKCYGVIYFFWQETTSLMKWTDHNKITTTSQVLINATGNWGPVSYMNWVYTMNSRLLLKQKNKYICNIYVLILLARMSRMSSNNMLEN